LRYDNPLKCSKYDEKSNGNLEEMVWKNECINGERNSFGGWFAYSGTLSRGKKELQTHDAGRLGSLPFCPIRLPFQCAVGADGIPM
jgi:hypothetical protein